MVGCMLDVGGVGPACCFGSIDATLNQITPPTKPQVVFMTPGVLLRKLGSDPGLREFSHVMIDEAR